MSEFDNPKRFQPTISDPPGGSYRGGIHNPIILPLYGAAISQWTHIEQLMIQVLEWLLFVDVKIVQQVASKSRGHTPGAQIFRSIGTHNYRVKLMKNLLSKFIGNLKKDPLYDNIIDDFAALGAKRNNYVHSMWWTHESGRVFMQEQLTENFAFGTKQEVTAKEFTDFLTQAANLNAKIQKLAWIEHQEIREELLRSLPDTFPKPPFENPQ